MQLKLKSSLLSYCNVVRNLPFKIDKVVQILNLSYRVVVQLQFFESVESLQVLQLQYV